MRHFLQTYASRGAIAGFMLLSLCFSLFRPWTVASVPTSSNRTSASCPQPPNGKDPATLTPQQLTYYGLPTFILGADQAYWKYVVRNLKHRYCTATRTNRMHTLLKANDSNSTNWSGYEANGDGGYNYAGTVIFVPSVPAGSPSGHTSIWVGLGGDGNQNLVQTGVDITVTTDSAGHTTSSAVGWVENLADSSNPFENDVFSVSPGDKVQASVKSNGEMVIWDIIPAGGKYIDMTYGPAANTSTADFIVERPLVGSGTSPLAQFSTAEIAGSYVTTLGGTGEELPPTTHQKITMVGDNGTTPLDSVGAIGAPGTSHVDEFYVTWLRSNS